MIQVILILLGVLVVVGGVCYAFYRNGDPADQAVTLPPPPRPDGCCGQHQVCELSLIADPSNAPEYFNDEELDRFAGRSGDDYTEQEVDEITDVLLTLQPDEVAPWARSIQLRGIQLPQTIRDQLLMMVAEARVNEPNTDEHDRTA